MKLTFNRDLTQVCEAAVSYKSKSAAMSPLQRAYRKLFRKVLEEKGLTHPFAQDQEDIIEFFQEVSERWAEKKAELLAEEGE